MSPGPGRGTPDEKQPQHRPDAASTNQPSEAAPNTPGGTPHGAPLTRQTQGKAPADLTPHGRPDAEWQQVEHISEASIISDDPRAATGSEGLAKQQAAAAAGREPSTRSGPALKASSSRSGSTPPAANPQPGGPSSPAAGIDPRSGATRATSVDSPAEASRGAYPAGKANSKDDLAQKLGFPSFLEFFEGSQPLSSEQNNVWYTSAVLKNQWVLWNSQTLEYSRPLPTLEQAKQASNITEQVQRL